MTLNRVIEDFLLSTIIEGDHDASPNLLHNRCNGAFHVLVLCSAPRYLERPLAIDVEIVALHTRTRARARTQPS